MPSKEQKKDRDKILGVFYKYAQTLVDVPGLGTRTFSYLIPEELKDKIKIGLPVLVPFGAKRHITAFIVGFSNYLEEEIKAKYIKQLLDTKEILSPEYLQILEWISNYYCCDLNTVLTSAIPMKFLKQSNKVKTRYEKQIKFLRNKDANKRQLEILDKLEKLGIVNLIEFEKSAKTTRATINKLEQAGFIEIIEDKIYRNPLNILNIKEKENFPELSPDQEKAYKIIENRMDKSQTEPILLHGITASGKTEVYFRAIEKTLKEGKNILFLAPEIALASQLTIRLAKRFGTDDVAIWHSNISDGERFDVWQKLRNDEIRILAGARSAVFAPLNNIGLIIIDEEHENSYKQDSKNPRYDARTVAKQLAKSYNASIILGSATPDVETYYKAVNSNNLVELKNRFNCNGLAKVSVIDMREEFNKQYKSIFSKNLLDEIRKNLDGGKQTILLINRRGFATQIQCLSCGEIVKCPNCDIPMILHKSDSTIKCHWCNKQENIPEKCPKCDSEEIKDSGLGTQKVELLIQKIFKTAKIARMDSDMLTTKTKHIEILDEFCSGKIDILIGTQMIAKGLDNKNVTLVGVINADSSFNLPDYRASERGFQLLTQVAGRAGRGEFEGKVFFQTFNPDFYAIENAKKQDYSKFYEEEIETRKVFDYPPFSQIIKIVIFSKNNYRAEKSAQEIALRLNTIIDKQGISERLNILGPSTCILERINNEYRYQIIIKNKMDKKGHFLINSFLKKIKMPDDIKLVIDINPIDIL